MRVLRTSSSAFTLVELLVVLFLLGLLVAVLLPALCRSTEQGNRVKCASNLRQIGLAIQMYANDNGGTMPRTRFDGSDSPAPTSFTGASAADPFAADGPAANDVSAAMYLVLRTQDLTSEVFVCPSSSADRSAGSLRASSNFENDGVLSYSLHNPYPAKACREAMKRDAYALAMLPADFALASDTNPGGAGVLNVAPDGRRASLQNANSRNHSLDGQNVLYGDGHVEFHVDPFAGATRRLADGRVCRDNIFVSGGVGTAATAAVNAAAVDALDTVLLPAADPAAAPSALATAMNLREHGARRLVWLASGGVLLAACGSGGIAWRVAQRRRRARAAQAN